MEDFGTMESQTYVQQGRTWQVFYALHIFAMIIVVMPFTKDSFI